MPDRFEGIADAGLDEAFLELVLDEHRRAALPRLERMWAYFRDPAEPVGASGWSADSASGGVRWGGAQVAGLPARFRGGEDDEREVVTENDIAWRVQTMVDFMFGKPVQILSTAGDGELRGTVERVLDAVWEASGGIALLQDMALLGHVYGHVDLALRLDEGALVSRGVVLGALERGSREALAELIRVEVIEPRRGIPVLNPDDYRRLDAFVIHFERGLNEVERAGSDSAWGSAWGTAWGLGRGVRRARGRDGRAPSGRAARRSGTVTEVLGPGRRVVFHDGEAVLRESSVLLPGVVPVVHIQNQSQPFCYEGLGEVEPLIGLQNELNTRLSDRARRVTMSSFQMYLARRLEGFEKAPVGPGRVWSTDDPDASIEAFGGDASCPSEAEHIEQIREAMDKVSGVPPLAGGVVRAKIGNLSSANALRITLMSLLAKTARKRVTYGAGIEKVSRMVLTALDAAGILRTHPGDRGIRLVWPDPQPIEPGDAVIAAKQKVELGVPRERALAGLGYAPIDAGVS
jgi:hypothetical protein